MSGLFQCDKCIYIQGSETLDFYPRGMRFPYDDTSSGVCVVGTPNCEALVYHDLREVSPRSLSFLSCLTSGHTTTPDVVRLWRSSSELAADLSCNDYVRRSTMR